MKRLSKRMIIVAAVAMLVCSLGMVGCGSNKAKQESQVQATEETTETTEATEEAPSGDAVELQIFAANSLTAAMAEAEDLYTQQHPEVAFADTQYEASGTLNEMLGAGQYADILITASASTMTDAEEKGYVDPATKSTMFTNELVIVTKEGGELAGQDITLEEIAKGTYTLSVGDENVPAGNYACQSLSTVDAYIEPDGAKGPDASGKEGEFSAELKDKVTLGAKVGDVCKYAETGDVDIAMVYTSDVYRMGGVSICSVVPADTHKPITYPGAVCKESKNAEAAAAFLEWCMTDEDCAQIWEKWGFELAA